MNQAAHIFAKDTRHLRWEIAISLALTAAYVFVAPALWKPRLGPYNDELLDELRLVAAILGLLVEISWWILITRVVQSESLVGDRQWWITKPYEWERLLGAKALFLGTFIFLPIAIAKSITLAEGGFGPFAHLPGLGYGLVQFAAYVILPLVGIAAVTSTFARNTLATLGVLLALVAGVIALALSSTNEFAVWWTPRLPQVILVCGCGAAIIVQYARRRTWTTRLMLAGALVVVFAALEMGGYSALIELTYPRAAAPLQITFLSGSKLTGYAQFASRGTVGIAVPVQISGIATGTAVNLDAVQMTAEGSDGRKWTSQWGSMFGARYRPDSDPDLVPPLPLRVDRRFYDAERTHPVTLHLRFATTELRAGSPVQIAMAAKEFSVPGFGICVPLDNESFGEFNDLHCRAAMRQPTATFVQVQWSDEKCGANGASAGTPIPGEGWAGALTSEPSSFGISGVEEVSFGLSGGGGSIPGHHGAAKHLCPGAPLTFTPYSVDRRTEYDVTFENYQMPELSPGTGSDN
jgi:hypothetical protein